MESERPETETVLRERFGEQVLGWTTDRGQACLHVKPERILEVLRFLRDDPSSQFDMLTDLTAVDYQRWPEDAAWQPPARFAVVYQLYSVERNVRLRVKAYLPEDAPELDSAAALWPAANWAEREAFDMFGIRFRGHPDLRRLLLPDNYEGHPLRKDYPLKGRGERDRFPKYTAIPEV